MRALPWYRGWLFYPALVLAGVAVVVVAHRRRLLIYPQWLGIGVTLGCIGVAGSLLSECSWLTGTRRDLGRAPGPGEAGRPGGDYFGFSSMVTEAEGSATVMVRVVSPRVSCHVLSVYSPAGRLGSWNWPRASVIA